VEDGAATPVSVSETVAVRSGPSRSDLVRIASVLGAATT
jgi:hypothetical protein